MGKLEGIKKTSRLIGRIGKVFQTVFGIFTGFLMICTLIVFVLRNMLNVMITESQASFDFRNMGWLAQSFAGKGKVAEAFVVFGLTTSFFLLMITAIMYFIAKIFKRFCSDYSPFLPEAVKDFKIVSILAVIIVLKNSIVLGIILGIVFWGIIQIYEYGCELQNQSDETL